MNSTALLEAITEARGRGLPDADPDGFAAIESLVARAKLLGDAGRARLERVAADRLRDLEARVSSLFASPPAGLDLDEPDEANAPLVDAWQRRDLRAFWLRRAALSLRAGAVRRGAMARRRWLERLSRRAIDAGLPPPTLDHQDPGSFARALSAAIASETMADVRAAVVVAAARAAVPVEVGPYNPGALGSQLLTKLDALSPRYLRHWIAAMEDVAALARLAPPPAPKPVAKPPPRKKPRAGKPTRAS